MTYYRCDIGILVIVTQAYSVTNSAPCHSTIYGIHNSHFAHAARDRSATASRPQGVDEGHTPHALCRLAQGQVGGRSGVPIWRGTLRFDTECNYAGVGLVLQYRQRVDTVHAYRLISSTDVVDKCTWRERLCTAK